jgi:hypothetical protein
MQATIYVTAAAMETISSIKDLDYYDRVSLSDEPEADLTTAPGYYLNTNALQLAELPADADVALHLTPSAPATYDCHVNIPAHLRGIIFSNAPDLPPQYSEIIGYWSPLHLTNHHRYAWAFFLAASHCTGSAKNPEIVRVIEATLAANVLTA